MSRSTRVLIVDDEPALLRMMEAYLTRRGYTVTTSETTDSALSEAESHPGEFAVAVLDATMSGLSMQDLAMRLLHANPAMGVIATSGYPVEMAAMEEAAPGRVMFLHKPFSPESLADAVRRMIGAQEKI